MKVRTLAALTGVVALTVGGATAVTANDPDAHAVRPDAGPVVVQDVEIAVPGQQPTRAYLVRPAHPSRDRSLAGILYLFLRGMTGDPAYGVFAWRPSGALSTPTRGRAGTSRPRLPSWMRRGAASC